VYPDRDNIISPFVIPNEISIYSNVISNIIPIGISVVISNLSEFTYLDWDRMYPDRDNIISPFVILNEISIYSNVISNIIPIGIIVVVSNLSGLTSSRLR
jgi:hypothetical protein